MKAYIAPDTPYIVELYATRPSTIMGMEFAIDILYRCLDGDPELQHFRYGRDPYVMPQLFVGEIHFLVAYVNLDTSQNARRALDIWVTARLVTRVRLVGSR